MRIIGLAFCLLLTLACQAQDCKVKSKALEGTYEGGCVKGLAQGKGKAVGTDSYTGDFANGLPHGQGRYQWANGDWYEGSWEKGKRSGYGTLHYADKTVGDSLYGFWKKDKYEGKYEEPYIIHYRTNQVSQIDVQQEKEKSNTLKEITIYVQSLTGGARQVQRNDIPKPKINSIEIIKGLYVQQFDQDLNIKRTATTLRMVQFPFRARFIIDNDVVDIEILEEGKWEVEIRLQR